MTKQSSVVMHGHVTLGDDRTLAERLTGLDCPTISRRVKAYEAIIGSRESLGRNHTLPGKPLLHCGNDVRFAEVDASRLRTWLAKPRAWWVDWARP